MELFVYENFNLSLNNPYLLLVKEFKEVIDNDESKDKGYAYKVFTFIYLNYNWKSPFKDYTLEERRKESLISSELKEDDLKKDYVIAACTKYEEIINSNITLSVIRDMKRSIDKFRAYFDVLDFTKTVESGAQKGTMLFKPKEYLDVMKRASEIFDSIALMEAKLKEQLEEKKDVRGGRTVARNVD